jgi:superfamily II DNA or RNA helicase
VSTVDVSPGTAYAGREANHALSFRQFNKSKHAQYFTPVWLAELLFEAMNALMPAEGPVSISVLDPTCGSGRLLAPFKAAGAQVLGIELDQLAADHARFAIGNQHVRTGDLLDYRNLLTGFSLVVTNPPYGIHWTPPDAGEVWTCETSGGLIESQGATLEIATRSLVYGGYLVAIIPTSTFQNTKDRFLRDTLYTQFEPVLQTTIPNLFAEEYGIAVEVDLVIARRTYRGYGSAWQSPQITIDGGDGPGRLRYALARALVDAPKLPVSTHPPVPVLSRLLAVTPSTAVRVTPKGLKAAADVDGLLKFLDETVTAFDPVRGIEHGMVSATLSPASLLTLGPRAGVESLAWLGFDPSISERDQQAISRLQEKYRILKTPIYPPEAHQRLAYIEDRSYAAKATTTADDQPCFTEGKAYHLRPSWIRNREVASVETVFDEREGKDVELITSVDRGYLAFQVITDSGPRTFREVDAADVELLTAAFDLPDVPDLSTIVPSRVSQHRTVVSRVAPFLFPFQQEDVARLAVKNFGYLGYEQGGGKTVTSAAWARVRGFKRVLVVCQSSLVENWLNELRQFGFPVQRLTTHAAVDVIQQEKRRKLLPQETQFYITSFEFLSLTGPRVYDAWSCQTFTKDGQIHHAVTDNTKASCSVCKRAYADVVKACPSCSDVSAWTGEHCNTCGYQAWSASRDSHQWPAYKRVKKLFSAVLVDEAQLAKSKNTLRGRAIRALKPKGKLILTGTLMKGFAHDIFWNVAWLLGFDNPLFPYAYRGGTKRFLSEFSTIQFVSRQFEDTLSEGRGKVLPEVSNLNRFWRLMASFSIRRRKDDIYVLPPKERQIVLLNMDNAHRGLYAGYAEWAQNAIAKALRESDGNPNMGIISGALWKLRYAATCPVARDYLDRGVLEAETWNKLEKIRELVRAASDRGEKTIIFSGLRVMVAAIVRHLQRHGHSVLPITAEVQAKKRFGLIQEFSRSPDVCAIVASLNCLNRGFTITAANHVILVDLEYSPEATEQAEDRVHRPGQTKPVYISYLLSRDTIDQVMHEILIQKSQAIRHAIDGKARFEDVAEILKRVTGDVQLEIAKRIQLLPAITLDIPLQPLAIEPEVVSVVETAIALDRTLDLRIVPILQVKQLSLFGFSS